MEHEIQRKGCNIMRVSRSRKPLQHFYSLGNEILQEVSESESNRWRDTQSGVLPNNYQNLNC